SAIRQARGSSITCWRRGLLPRWSCAAAGRCHWIVVWPSGWPGESGAARLARLDIRLQAAQLVPDHGGDRRRERLEAHVSVAADRIDEVHVWGVAGVSQRPRHAAGDAMLLQGPEAAEQAQHLVRHDIDDAHVLDAASARKHLAEAPSRSRIDRHVARVAGVGVLGIPPGADLLDQCAEHVRRGAWIVASCRNENPLAGACASAWPAVVPCSAATAAAATTQRTFARMLPCLPFTLRRSSTGLPLPHRPPGTRAMPGRPPARV